MPNMKNAKKHIKVSAKKAEANNNVISSMRTAIKATNKSLTNSEVDTEQSLALATKKINKAVSKGTIHKNKAARLKSALAKSTKKTA